MTGYDDAVEWIKGLKLVSAKDCEMRDRTVERMRYEADKARVVKPNLNKGLYGKRFDSYTCGHCGRTLVINDNYCPNCGFRIGWDSTRCLTGR